MALTAPAVSARLRRWWLHEALVDSELLASDLGDALLECRLVRVAADLRVQMPYDFGTGSPFDPALTRRLTDRVAELSEATVRRLVMLFDSSDKPTTRRRSSELDVYESGDPVWDDWPDAAAELARAIERSADGRSIDALRGLRLAGVSRHRMWLAVTAPEAARAIGITPGAAATLKIAVARVQGRKAEEALYSVISDPRNDTVALF